MAFRQYLFNKFQSFVPSLVTGQSWPQVIDTTGALSINAEGRKSTYSLDLSFVTPLAGVLNQPFVTISGSNTKLIRIVKVRFSISAATGASTTISLGRISGPVSGGTVKASFANTLGLDLLDPPATSVLTTYTAIPATIISSIMSENYEVVTNSVSVLPQIVEWKFGDSSSQALVLRGSNQLIGLSVGNPGTTPVAGGFIEWTEE